jgi:Fe-S cluster assembly protein SufD
MIEITLEKDVFLARFQALEKLGRKGPSWLNELRRSGINRYAEMGFPTTNDEEWRFTNVAPIAKTPFAAAEYRKDAFTPARLDRLTFGDADEFRIVFVNGRFSKELSSGHGLPAGIRVVSLAQVLETSPDEVKPWLGRYARYENHAFAALNTAFIEDGAFVHVPDGVVVQEPIHVIHASAAGSEPTASHPRTLIVVGKSAQVRIVESYAGGSGVYLTNAVTEVVAGENAVVDHYKLQNDGLEAYHTASLELYASRNAVLSNHSISIGAALARNDVNLVLDGEGAEGTINGLYIVTGNQHVDNHTGIDHAKPHCASHELYKGVLDKSARAVFNGRIRVRQDAQKTDSKQTNKNLLLSNDALVNTNPQLEIYADDVKCTHGATIGQLDETALFYLRTRGIGLEAARHVLTYAFANDVVERIQVPELKVHLDEYLIHRLRDDGGAES